MEEREQNSFVRLQQPIITRRTSTEEVRQSMKRSRYVLQFRLGRIRIHSFPSNEEKTHAWAFHSSMASADQIYNI